MNPLCIVFDLDDTLYLEREYVWSGFRALEPWVKSNLGVRDFRASAWRLFEQGVRGRIFDEVLLQSGVEPRPLTITTMVDLYRRHRPRINMAPDADRCLERLQGRVDLALITDGPECSQRNKIDALCIGWRFQKVVLTSTLGATYEKPHVKAFLAVQETLGGPADRYIYVGDNPQKDFVGPRRLGWKTVRIRRAQGLYSSAESVQGEDADHEVFELTSQFDSLFSVWG